MKKHFLLFLAIGFAVSIKAQLLTDSLIAYYPFNGNALDASGNGHHAFINTATLTTDRLGIANSAYYFDGISSIEVPHSSQLDITGDKTICAWTYVSSGTSLLDYPCVIIKPDFTGSYPTYGLQYLETIDYGIYRYKYDFIMGQGTTNYEAFSSQLYTNYFDQWVYIVGTYSKANGVSKIYINGLLSDSTVTGSITSNSNTNTMFIGSDRNAGDSYFIGKIDDIRIYNRVLSGAEVNTLYYETIGIKELTSNTAISVYPNPIASSSVLKLNSQVKDAEVSICDVLGKEMLKKKFSGNSIEIEKGNLKSGVYFVRVRDNERDYLQKVIVE